MNGFTHLLVQITAACRGVRHDAGMTDFDPIDPSDPFAQLAGLDSATAVDEPDEGTRQQWRELNAADLPQVGGPREESIR